MPKICYISKRRFSGQWLEMIRTVNIVLEEYGAQGYELTLRQLYYQLVARDLFPDTEKWSFSNGRWVRSSEGTKNADPNYGWLGRIVNDGRLAGLIDWNYVVDRTRGLKELAHFKNAADALHQLADWYYVDMWKRQDVRLEVWIEKDALVGVIEGVCQEFDVPYFSCRGYTSQSEMWRAAMRLKTWVEAGQEVQIIHLGDHDPSGVDMSRDIFDRIKMFMGGVEVRRIALNMDQVEEFNPPPNPAKITDSRCGVYVEKYGDKSWELDALEPSVINGLIRDTILARRDSSIYEEDLEYVIKTRERLSVLAREF